MKRAIVVVLVLLAGGNSIDAQWTQWRGPGRDGVVPAASVPASWPKALTPVWRRSVGDGYASPVTDGARLFVHSRDERHDVITALSLSDGRPVWTGRHPSTFVKNKYAAQMSAGPFSTPLVAGGVLYTLGATAVLTAWDAASGEVRWRHDWTAEVDTSRLFTGTAMSPLLDSGLLIVHVGDDRAGALRALDPASGAEKWKLTGHGPGYASPIVATFGGTRQLVTLTDKAVIGVAIADGRALWQIPFADEWNENIVTPVVAGDILVVSGTRKGTLGYRIASAGGTFTATEAWQNTELPMYMSSPVVDGALLYGFSTRRKGQLFCLDATTGKVRWATEGRGGTNASIQRAGDHLLVLTSEGDLIVVRPTPEKYQEVRRYKVGEQTWAHPVLLGDAIALRDGADIAVLAIGGK